MPKVNHRTVIDTRLPHKNQARQVFIKRKEENKEDSAVRQISMVENKIAQKKHVTIAENKNVTVTISDATGPGEETKKSKKDKKKKSEEVVEMVYRAKQPSAPVVISEEKVEKEESKQEEESKEAN